MSKVKGLATGGGANRWKFQSFQDRINAIKIDVIHSAISHRHEEADNDSIFVGQLAQWDELNCTAEYSDFSNLVSPLAKSLPMVLYHKDKLIDLIVRHLAVPSSNAYEPILCLTTSLAKDLRHEFFPYLGRIVAAVVPILRRNDPAVIEHGFQCIAYLLRYLQRSVLLDITAVFDILAPLLGQGTAQKAHIRQFAAESVSFMTRKLKRDQIATFITHICASVDIENDRTWREYASALGSLISNTVCHVNQTLHSCHVPVLSAFVRAVLDHPSTRRDFVMTSALESIISHVSSTTNLPIVRILLDIWSADPDRVSTYLLACIHARKGGLATSYAHILESFSNAVESLPCITASSMDVLAHVLLRAEYPEIIKALGTIQAVTGHSGLSVEVLMEFHCTLIEGQFSAYTSIILPATVRHLRESWRIMDTETVVAFFVQVLSKIPLLHSAASSVITPNGKLIFDPEFPIVDAISAQAQRGLGANSDVNLYLISAITVASKLDLPRDGLEAALTAVLEQSVVSSSTLMFAHTLKTLIYLQMVQSDQISEIVSRMPMAECPYLLDALCAYIQQSKVPVQCLRDEWTAKISPLVSSFHQPIRRPVLSVLAYLYPDNCLLDYCSKFEATENSFQELRTRNMLLKNIALYMNLSSTHVEIITEFAFALFSVNFAPLWPAVNSLILRLLDLFPERTWKAIADLLVKFQSCTSFPQLNPSIPEIFSLEPSVFERLLHAHAEEQFAVVFERVDYWNIFSLVLKAISGHTVTETKSRFLVPYFFEFIEREYRVYHDDIPSLPIETTCKTDLPFKSKHPMSISYHLVNKKLMAFLDIFSNFKPAQVHKADVLFRLYECLLLRPESDLQRAVLSCINTYNYDWYTPYHELFLGLVDEAKFRNTLLTIKLTPGSSGLSIDAVTFKPHHRDQVFPVMLRVLYGRMMCRKGRVSSRRTNILSLVAAASDSEIQFLFRLMAPTVLSTGKMDDSILSQINLRKTAGFLTLMEEVLKQISLRVSCIIAPVVDLLASIAVSASMAIKEHKDKEMDVEMDSPSIVDETNGEAIEEGSDEEDDDFGEAPHLSCRILFNLRSLSLRRLVALFKLGIAHDYAEHVQKLFETVIEPQLAVMHKDNHSSISPSFNLLCSWSVKHFDMFRPFAPAVLRPMISCLVCFEPVRTMVLDSLYSVLQHDRGLIELVAGDLFQQSADLITPKSVGYMTRLIELCSQMASFIRPELAPMLVPVLLPVVTSPKGTPAIKKSILVILQSCLHFLPHADVTKILIQLSRLFAVIQEKSSRLQLVELTYSLATVLELPHVGSIIRGLNQYHARRFEELDYDVVLSSFTQLIKKHEQLLKLEWMPVLYNVIYLITNDDLSARGNSTHVLSLFVHLAAKEGPDDNGEYQKLVQSVVYSSFKIAIKSPKHVEQVRSEWLKVLLECVKHLGHMPIFAGMVPLLPKDATDESSFFENMYHVQIHRRQRALVRLRDHIPRTCPATLMHVFLPLITHTLSHKDPNLVNEAVLTITSITQNLPWGSYLRTLRKFFSLLRAGPEKRREKVLMRAVVAILNGFHFEIAHMSEADLAAMDVELTKPSDIVASPEAAGEIVLSELHDEQEAEEDDVEEVEEESLESSESAQLKQKCKILSVITSKIIPELNQYLISRKQTDDSVMTVRVPIALGTAHLINWLPEREKRIQIPALITKLAQLLRARLQSTRTATSKTLIEVLNVLGSEYLFFMVKELRGALLRGYQVHVLGYTVHAILGSIELSPAILRACVKDLCAIVSNDIFGDVGKEKDAEDYVKTMKELKTCMSFDTCELIATHADIDTLTKLLLEVKDVLVGTRDLGALEKVQKVLKRITPGFIGNQHITVDQIMKFIHSLIVGTYNLANGEDVFDASTTINVASTETKTVNATATSHWKGNSHHFVEFGLRLLQAYLRSSRLCIKNETHMQMLNSMVDVVGKCFQSKHNNTFILASHAMQRLCRMPLSELRGALPFVISKTFNTIVSLPNGKSDIAQASFKLIHSVMNACDYIPFTQKQVKQLLRLLRPEIDDQDNHTITYSLLKSIISRRIVVNEVYEMMLVIGHILVTSHSANVQDLCRTVYLQFLLHYPQGKQRIENHMSWMVKNLGYQYEQGRVAVLELVNAVVRKLPEEILSEYGEMIFVGLVSLLTSESTKCQEMAAQVIQCLVARMKTCIAVTKMVHTWYLIPKTCAVAVQVHGILILAGRDTVQLSVNLQSVFDNYKPADGSDELEEPEIALEEGIDTNSDWQLIYHAILTLTKLITASKIETCIPVISVLQPHLTHAHSWIRIASSRCMGEYFVKVSGSGFELKVELGLETVRLLVRDYIRQLQSEYLNQELASLAVKNLFYLIKRIHALQSSWREEVTEENGGVVNHDEEEYDANNMQMKTSGKDPLQSTLQFLSFIARKDQTRNRKTLLRQSVFQIFAAISNYLSVDDLMTVVHSILAPIYRTSQDVSVKGQEWDDLRHLSEEIMELIQTKLGQTQFNQVYAKMKMKSDDKRQSRKQYRAELMVTNPKAAIQRKISRNLQKGRQKKRRAEVDIQSRIHLDVKRSKTRHCPYTSSACYKLRGNA